MQQSIQLQNNEIAQKIVDYLNTSPRAITSELMREVNPSGLNTLRIYQALFSGFIGLDPDNDHDRMLEETYIWPGIQELSINEFINDPYYQYIKIPIEACENWNFTYEKYEPFEAFVCNDIKVNPDGVEIPQIGYFTQAFQYPVVEENGREWMAIKPSEILSMREPIKAIRGNVITFGLGLGYFAFMASEKNDVKQVTIIERDPHVIHLFTHFILPQFPHKEKINIIHEDAFVFMQSMTNNQGQAFDYAFVDLWHDASDGLELYLRSKQISEKIKDTRFLFWVENTLRSAENWYK